MNTFGQKRGEVAHASAAVVNVTDPVAEKNLIKLVMSGIRDLDSRLQRL